MQFSQPGTYTQVLTLSNFGESVTGIEVEIMPFFRDERGCPTTTPDAWRFDNLGCQQGRFSIGFVSAAEACPMFGGSNRQTDAVFTSDDQPRVHVKTTFGKVSPSPDSTYTVMSIAYDHTSSTAGPSHDGLCGGVERSVCFQLQVATYQRPDGSTGSIPCCDAIVWQAADGCSFCDAALSSSWGKVKAIYR
jgi:hypothetical protein